MRLNRVLRIVSSSKYIHSAEEEPQIQYDFFYFFIASVDKNSYYAFTN